MMPQKLTGFGKDFYSFTGRGTVKPLLGGTYQKLASATGARNTYEPGHGQMYELLLCGTVRKAAQPLAAGPPPVWDCIIGADLTTPACAQFTGVVSGNAPVWLAIVVLDPLRPYTPPTSIEGM